MVLIDMEKPLSCEECRFCEYEQGHCTALPVGEWRRITDASECPLTERKTGKWEEKYMTEEEWIRGAPSKVCPFCHKVNHNGRTHYCPHCGEMMEVDE